MAFESSRSFVAGVAGMLIVFAAVAGWRWNNQRIATNRAAAIEEALLSDPVLAALKAREPATFKDLAAFVRATTKAASADRAALVAEAQRQYPLTAAMNTFLVVASDRAVMEYAGAIALAAEELGQKDGALCFALLYGPADSGVDFRSALSPKAAAAVSAATVSVIREPSETSVPGVRPYEPYQVARPVMDRLHRAYGDDADFVNRPFHPGQDKARICDVTVAFLRGVLELPPAQAGVLLRSRMRAQA